MRIKPSNTIVRYYLNTGEHTIERTTAPLPEVVTRLRTFISSGGGSMRGLPGVQLSINANLEPDYAVFSFLMGDQPIETYAIAWTESGSLEAWRSIETFYLTISDHVTFEGANAEPVRPTMLPWLGVVTFPCMSFSEREALRGIRMVALWLTTAFKTDRY